MHQEHHNAGWFFRTAFPAAVFLFAIFLSFSVQAQDQSAIPKILVINSYHRATWSEDILSGIQSVLSGDSDVFFYIEYMDTKRVYTEEYLRELHDLYALKYRDMTFDVIIAVDDNAYQYVLKYHDDLFKNIPVVFCGVGQFDPTQIVGQPITGVLEKEPYEETLSIAFKLQPQTKMIYALCDHTVTAEINLERFKRIIAAQYPGVEYKLLRDLTVDEMSQALSKVPSDAIVLAISWWHDRTGKSIYQEEWTEILSHTNRPVFGFSTWQVGRGLMGGKCSSGFKQGRIAGEMTKQVLEGTDIGTLPVFDNNNEVSVYMFDYMQLQKYHISESLLPKGAIVINAPVPFYTLSKELTWVLVGGLTGLFGLVLGLVMFISHHRSVHQTVQEQEQRFRNLVETTSDWIWEVDADGRYTYVSPRSQNILGYEPQELIGKTPFDLMTAEEADRLRPIFQEAVEQKQPIRHLENINLDRNGKKVILETNGIPLLDKIGRLTGYRGVDRDITERKKGELAVRQQQAEINSILRAAPVGIGLLSNRVFLHINEQICAMTGYADEELVGRNARMLYPSQEEYEYVGREKYQQIAEEGIGTVETRWRRKDGKIIDVLLSSTPIDADDWSKGVIFNALDITEAKLARQMAIAERDRAQQYLDIAGVMIMVLDAEGRIKLLNKKGCEILECTESRARGKDWFAEFLPESTRKIARKAFCDLIIGQGNTVEYFENSVITTTGKEKLIAWHNTVIREEGEIVGTLSSGMDITNQRDAEQTLQFTQFAFDHAGEAAYWVDRDEKCVYANEMGCQMLGYTRDELMQMSVRDTDPFYPPEAWGVHWDEMRQKRTMRFEGRHKRKDGTVFPVEITSNFMTYEGKEYICSFVRDITNRKAAEHQREEMMRQLQFTQFATDHAGEAAFWMGSDAKFIYVNDAACEALKYSKEQLLTMSVQDIAPDFPADIWPQHWQEVKEKRSMRFESRHKTSDGYVFPVEVTVNFLEYENQEYLCAFVRDITNRKRAEDAIRESEEFLSSIVENIPDMVFIKDAKDLKFVRVNRAVEELLGFSRDELISKDDFDLFPKEQAQHFSENDKKAIENRTLFDIPEEPIETNHGERLLHTKKIPILDDNGDPAYLLGISEDITERKAAERALQFTQFAVDHAGEAAFWMNPDGTFFYVNEKACQSLGYTREELLSLNIYDIDPNFSAEMWADSWQQLRLEGVRQIETYHKTKDGRVFPVEINANFVEYDGIEYNCAFARDITERKQTEEALRESEDKHRSIFTSASDAIFILDKKGFIECNPQAVKLFGCEDASEIISKSPADFSPTFQENGRLSSEVAPEMNALVLEGKPQRFPWVYQHKDGSFIFVEVSLNPIQLKGKTYIQALVHDMTEQRLAKIWQDKLLKELQSKNEELESIVFIASHDLRSPLVNIRGFSGELEKSLVQIQRLLADENLGESAQKQLEYLFNIDIPESLSFIKAGNQKMDVLLTGLLRLSRIGSAQVCSVELDMYEMLEAIVNNFRFRTRSEEIEITVDKPMPACRGDAVLINQVFSNLIDNAIKYRHPGRKAKIHVSAEIKSEGIVYCVADNGIGIDPEHVKKVFEIFHRLNPGDKDGEGLGLTIIARILDRQDGHVWIESKPDVGTSVYVQLPRVS